MTIAIPVAIFVPVSLAFAFALSVAIASAAGAGTVAGVAARAGQGVGNALEAHALLLARLTAHRGRGGCATQYGDGMRWRLRCRLRRERRVQRPIASRVGGRTHQLGRQRCGGHTQIGCGQFGQLDACSSRRRRWWWWMHYIRVLILHRMELLSRGMQRWRRRQLLTKVGQVLRSGQAQFGHAGRDGVLHFADLLQLPLHLIAVRAVATQWRLSRPRGIQIGCHLVEVVNPIALQLHRLGHQMGLEVAGRIERRHVLRAGEVGEVASARTVNSALLQILNHTRIRVGGGVTLLAMMHWSQSSSCLVAHARSQKLLALQLIHGLVEACLMLLLLLRRHGR